MGETGVSAATASGEKRGRNPPPATAPETPLRDASGLLVMTKAAGGTHTRWVHEATLRGDGRPSTALPTRKGPRRRQAGLPLSMFRAVGLFIPSCAPQILLGILCLQRLELGIRKFKRRVNRGARAPTGFLHGVRQGGWSSGSEGHGDLRARPRSERPWSSLVSTGARPLFQQGRRENGKTEPVSPALCQQHRGSGDRD